MTLSVPETINYEDESKMIERLYAPKPRRYNSFILPVSTLRSMRIAILFIKNIVVGN